MLTDFERLKIVLYQYIIFKGDFYKSLSDEAFNNIRYKKDISSSDIFNFYKAKLKSENFEDFQKEIYDILSSFNSNQ